MKKLLTLITILILSLSLCTTPVLASTSIPIDNYINAMQKLYSSYGHQIEMINANGVEYVSRLQYDKGLKDAERALLAEAKNNTIDIISKDKALKSNVSTKALMPYAYSASQTFMVGTALYFFNANYYVTLNATADAQHNIFLAINSYSVGKSSNSMNVASWSVSGLSATMSNNKTSITVSGMVTTDFSYVDPIVGVAWQNTLNTNFSKVFYI